MFFRDQEILVAIALLILTTRWRLAGREVSLIAVDLAGYLPPHQAARKREASGVSCKCGSVGPSTMLVSL